MRRAPDCTSAPRGPGGGRVQAEVATEPALWRNKSPLLGPAIWPHPIAVWRQRANSTPNPSRRCANTDQSARNRPTSFGHLYLCAEYFQMPWEYIADRVWVHG